jgi:hypothetical protein
LPSSAQNIKDVIDIWLIASGTANWSRLNGGHSYWRRLDRRGHNRRYLNGRRVLRRCWLEIRAGPGIPARRLVRAGSVPQLIELSEENNFTGNEKDHHDADHDCGSQPSAVADSVGRAERRFRQHGSRRCFSQPAKYTRRRLTHMFRRRLSVARFCCCTPE